MWPILLAAILAYAVFGAVVGLSAARELASVRDHLLPRGRIADRYRGLVIVVTTATTLVPQTLLLLEIWPQARATVAIAVFGPLPIALYLGRKLSGAYFTPRGFEQGRLYPQLGVRIFKQIVPDGDLVSRVERRNGAQAYFPTREILDALERRGRAAERGHFISLTAVLPSIALAIWWGFIGYAVVLVAVNVIFHVYPMMLQRYTRIRLLKVRRGIALETMRERSERSG